jgi:hypothetical protein
MDHPYPIGTRVRVTPFAPASDSPAPPPFSGTVTWNGTGEDCAGFPGFYEVRPDADGDSGTRAVLAEVSADGGFLLALAEITEPEDPS